MPNRKKDEKPDLDNDWSLVRDHLGEIRWAKVFELTIEGPDVDVICDVLRRRLHSVDPEVIYIEAKAYSHNNLDFDRVNRAICRSRADDSTSDE
ncbi:hypothetical protein [Mycolicibacterium wolinskyi]|uniref:hypothetical protein n=1 Tax=Mycolicibacterium wolinskyi TaxID=59750 RepID=UPI000AEDB176|nr:hypothetical protein [Mycolicibacterium wolinskyi]